MQHRLRAGIRLPRRRGSHGRKARTPLAIHVRATGLQSAMSRVLDVNGRHGRLLEIFFEFFYFFLKKQNFALSYRVCLISVAHCAQCADCYDLRASGRSSLSFMTVMTFMTFMTVMTFMK